MSLQLASVIDSLKEAPLSVVPILATLNAERDNLAKISKVDLKHLTSRTLNLCKANDAYSIWSGVSIVHILLESVVVLVSEGLAFFAQLIKILNSPFSNDNLILESTVECIAKLCANIRGKPTLTREILVPNLSGLFTGFMARVEQDPVLLITALKILIEEHPTTSRPFANKLKTKLLSMLSGDFLSYPEKLQGLVCATLATLPIIEKEGPDVHWRQDVDRIIANIAGTVDVYTNFLNAKDDQDVGDLFKKLLNAEEPGIFSDLDIDINTPTSILSISTRVEILLKMLQGYLVCGSRFTVPVPVGRVLAVIELVCSVNTKFLPFRGEIRDQEIKELVEVSLSKCYEAALAVLGELPAKYSGVLVPHLSYVLSILELLVFLNNKLLDKLKCLQNETMLVKVVACAKNFLLLLTYFPDYASISRVVEVALFLVQPRSNGLWLQPDENKKLSHSSKAARKKAKRNASVPLADLLSHEHLFVNTVLEHTRTVVLEFFAVVLKTTPISSTQFNKFAKLVIVDAVKSACKLNHNAIPKDIKELLLAALLHPAPESASILPIAASVLPRSELLEVFIHPRFPPLPLMLKNTIEEESEDEEVLEPVRPAKKQKTRREESKSVGPESTQDIFTSKAFKTVEENNQDIEEVQQENLQVEENILQKKTPESVSNEKLETATLKTDMPESESFKTPEENAEDIAEVKAANNVEESEEDSGSELEIPDLDLEESDDEN